MPERQAYQQGGDDQGGLLGGQGPLSSGEGPIRNALQNFSSGGPDLMQNGDGGDGDGSVEVPENPGPPIIGRTPVVGSVRRANDLPVLRDEVPSTLGA